VSPLLFVVLALLAALPATADDRSPFSPQLHDVDGRIHQVWVIDAARCTHAARDLLVLHGVGGAPDEEKRVTWMPCGSALVPATRGSSSGRCPTTSRSWMSPPCPAGPVRNS